MSTQFKILFDENRNPLDNQTIRYELSEYPDSYYRVVKIIIENSSSLTEGAFRYNVATLMPSFGMARTPKSAFYGMKIENENPIDSKYHVLDVCWKEFADELQDIKTVIIGSVPHRSRVVLELSQDSKSLVFSKISCLFDKIEWTSTEGINIGRVGASKILFTVFPEIALPVDNSEWDFVFRTHNYGKVLSLMANEIKDWENKTGQHLETLDSYPRATLPSVYNVMAMRARPKRGWKKKD